MPTPPLPEVSIVVLNHNYERYVGQALASAVGQVPGAYRLAEIVVVDDGSTDRSRDVYARFPRVRVTRKPHEGFAATLTRAVQEACCDWFAPLDADDVFTRNKLAALAPHLTDPDLLVIQHAEYVVGPEGRPFSERVHPGGSTSTVLVRTDAARDLLPVTNELFFHTLAESGFGRRVPEPLAWYRVHEASMTDRHTPGVFADYMAGVCLDVSTRLNQLRDHPPSWASHGQLAELAATYKNRAAQYRDTAHSQRNRTAAHTAWKRRSA